MNGDRDIIEGEAVEAEMGGEIVPHVEQAIEAASPLDAPVAVFKGALERRGTNRKAMMDWVREALKEGLDYGKVVGKKSLWKPGAEKICGMLGLRVTFPTLPDYETAALEGRTIEDIIIRCHLLDAHGNVVSDGVGARNVTAEDGDLNKALKMALKSAHIDATLRCAGLSEVFTQDLEDMDLPDKKTADTPLRERRIGFGKYKDETWGWALENDSGYLDWLAANAHDVSTRNLVAELLMEDTDEPDPLNIDACERSLRSCNDMEELMASWATMTKEQHKAVQHVKDEMKTKLESDGRQEGMGLDDDIPW